MKTVHLAIPLLAMFFVSGSFAYAVELKLGEKIHYDENLDLYFYDIEDSRCPLDVTCIWEGEVTAIIQVQNQTHKILENFSIDSTSSSISPYDVTLIDVVPHPVSTETPNYVAILDIAKFAYPNNFPSENSVAIISPLKQFKDSIPFHETKCNVGLQLTQKYDGSPACVKPETVLELIKRGWVSDVILAVQSRDFLEIKGATSSYMEEIIPTLDDFKDTLSESHDIDTIFSKFGEPHDDIGSGIHIYVYELNDSTEIWIGYVDDIWYVKHVNAEGNVSEDLFVKDKENPENCPLSFNSRCFSESVTEIIDGNTIRIGGGTVRLALLPAPDLDEDGGMEAKKFIEVLCPPGSEVLFDQDDLQPLDRYYGGAGVMGTPLGVVYCNGLNLNEELAKSKYGQISTWFCENSEFGNSDWARNNGCLE